jgi:hypothetical protein
MKKFKKTILSLTVIWGLMLLTGNSIVRAEPFMNIYFKAMKNKHSEEYRVVKFYLETMGSGMHWTNKILADKGREKLYCPSKDTTLNAENYIYIINEFLDNNPYVKKTAEGYPIGLIQIISLIDTFPCTKPVPAK